MENFDIPKLSSVLSESANAVKNWRRIYDALNLSPADAENIGAQKITGLINNYELFTKILQDWKSVNGNAATIQNVESVLRNLNLVDAADKIQNCAECSTPQVGLLKLPLRHNIQGVVSKYVARPHLEKQIIDSLKMTPNPECQIKFPVVVLHGFGGVGKTTIAKKICQLKEGSVIWIDSEKEEFILQGFAKLLGSNTGNKAQIVLGLQNVFSLQFKTNECLLVFDNVNCYKMLLDYLPLNLVSKISVLITSNSIWDSCDYGEVKHIPVEKFTVKEFSEFVKKIIPDVSELEIRELHNYTGRFPYLANIVCYGFAKWRRPIPGRNIREYLETKGNKITNAEFLIYTKTDEEIVEKQMNLLKLYYEEDGEVAYEILCILAYCYSDFNEQGLLSIAKSNQPLQLIVASKDTKILEKAVDVSLKILVEQGFIENTSFQHHFSIHRSHQIAVRYFLQKLEKELELIKHLIDYYKEDDSFGLFNTLDLNLLMNCGKSYGDEVLGLMLNNKKYITYLMNTGDDGAIKEMAEFARRTKSNDEYTRWAVYESGLLDRYEVVEDIGFIFDDLFINNLSSLFSVLKPEEKEKLNNLIWLLAKKKEWLAAFFTAFPEMLHDKKYFSVPHAVYYNKLIALEFLIHAGSDVNAKYDNKWTGLELAILNCNVEAAEMLLKAGADPNLQDRNGLTPLYFLFYGEEKIELLNLLLQYNANPNIKDNARESFLEEAKEKGFDKFVQIIERHVNK